ncbi:MAG: sugar phosphate isomerase/epimerase family protein [Anaerolineae bacterium]
MLTCLNNATTGAETFEAFATAASDAGFEAIEVGLDNLEAYAGQHSLADLKAFLSAKHLKLGSGGLPVDWRAPEAKFRQDLEALPKRLEFGRELGLRRYCTWIPPRWDKPYAEVFAFARERFSAIADAFAPYGATFGLEFVGPQGGFRTTQYKFISTLAEVMHLIDRMGRDNVGVMIDSYHLFVGEATLAEIAALPAPRIVQFHINDAYVGVPREELEDLKRLLPGEGAIPLVPMLRAVASTGYDWTVSIETFNQEVKAMGPAAAARRAKAGLDGLLAVI